MTWSSALDDCPTIEIGLYCLTHPSRLSSGGGGMIHSGSPSLASSWRVVHHWGTAERVGATGWLHHHHLLLCVWEREREREDCGIFTLTLGSPPHCNTERGTETVCACMHSTSNVVTEISSTCIWDHYCFTVTRVIMVSFCFTNVIMPLDSISKNQWIQLSAIHWWVGFMFKFIPLYLNSFIHKYCVVSQQFYLQILCLVSLIGSAHALTRHY